MDVVEYAEAEGRRNLLEKIEVAGMIQREANTTLALMLGGAGAAALIFASTPVAPAGRVALALCALWGLLAAVLTFTVLALGDYPSVHNEPENLNLDGYSLDAIRRGNLDVLHGAIGRAVAINNRRAAWLNRCRAAAAIATPAVAVLAWLAVSGA